ncbi:hypothetical protein HKX48_006787 [Thoreauomyces humboldtii]|nr:hypothetical protein HKX48_006787 [Thoreauomyces humboldtii]
MRSRAPTDDIVSSTMQTLPESKSGTLGRLGKMASLISTSQPSSPAPLTSATGAAAVQPPSALGILGDFPAPLLLKIVQACAPELKVVRNLSKGYREVVGRYIQKRTKRFQESIEEAECWGHRAPTLSDIVHLDPLALANILEVHYGSKLGRTSTIGATATSPSDGGALSELGLDDNDGATSEAATAPRPAAARPIKREQMQRIAHAAIRSALDSYEDCGWATVGVLREFVVRHGLQHAGSEGADGNVLTRLATGGTLPNAQSERDMSDGSSVRSLRTAGASLNAPSNGSSGSTEALGAPGPSKDPNWLRVSSELHRQATLHGHAFNLPSLTDLDDPTATLSLSSDLAVRSHQPSTLVATLDAARMNGSLWLALDRGFQAALAVHRWGKRVPLDVLLVLLDATFNDPMGPWAAVRRVSGWGMGPGTEEENGRVVGAARGLVVRGEECAKLYGIAWHRLSAQGSFAVVPVEEVAREIRSRLRIMG